MPADTKLPKGEISKLISKGHKQRYLFRGYRQTFQDERKAVGIFDDFLSSIDGYVMKFLGQK